MFTSRLYGQALPMLTDPLKVREIEVLSEKLELTTVQLESMIEVYDRYLVDFARVRNGDVKTFEDSMTSAAEEFGFMSFKIPEREQVETLITQGQKAIKSIHRVDRLFFDEIAGMLTEKQQRIMQRLQVEREVEAYSLIAMNLIGELNNGARVHITELYNWVDVEESEEVDLILETYEKRYLKLAVDTYDELVTTIRLVLDMVDELGIRGLDQQALMMKFMTEEAIEDLKIRGDILLKTAPGESV